MPSHAIVPTAMRPLVGCKAPPLLSLPAKLLNEAAGQIVRISAGTKRIAPLAIGQPADQIARPPHVLNRDVAKQRLRFAVVIESDDAVRHLFDPPVFFKLL